MKRHRMKHLFLKIFFGLLLLGGLSSCENESAFTPGHKHDEHCVKFIGFGCASYEGNYGNDFQSALDSLMRKERKYVESLITQLEEECSDCGYNRNETLLGFDTLQVADDDIILDRSRTYINVWLYIQRKPFDSVFSSEPIYVHLYNYGIIDSRGDRYIWIELPD